VGFWTFVCVWVAIFNNMWNMYCNAEMSQKTVPQVVVAQDSGMWDETQSVS
jgi:hypothetical protein